MRILGIDPGSIATGYGVLEGGPGRLVHVAHGTLRPRAGASLALRLAELHREIAAVIAAHEPELAVVERVFVAASARSALVLGQARGVALAALAGAGLGVAEYSASEIKRAATGSGRADKRDVQRMVSRLLGLARVPAPDAADALAAAICYVHAGPLAGLERRGQRRPRTARGWQPLPRGGLRERPR